MIYRASVSPPFDIQTDDEVRAGFVQVLEQMGIEAGRFLEYPRGTLSASVHGELVFWSKTFALLLWFASPAFSSSEMELSKSRLRKASRLLAAQRDFVVMQSILEQLAQKTSNSAVPRQGRRIRLRFL